MREPLLSQVVSQLVLHKDVERLSEVEMEQGGEGGTVGRDLK